MMAVMTGAVLGDNMVCTRVAGPSIKTSGTRAVGKGAASYISQAGSCTVPSADCIDQLSVTRQAHDSLSETSTSSAIAVAPIRLERDLRMKMACGTVW